MLKAVVQGRIAVPHADRLRAGLGEGWKVETFNPEVDDVHDFATLIHDATAIIGGAIPLPAWPAVPQLKLFQIPWAGYEFCSPETMPLGVPVCNCFEHETAIAEYIMLAMLEWQIGLRLMDRRFRSKGWDGKGPGEAHFHGEVLGRTVGIVGYGHIGREVARRANGFGMKVQGIRRKAQPTPDELVWLGTSADLERLLATSDFIVIACDLNAETRKLINAERLAQMKPDAVIINIARGGVIDEQALFEACRDRRIGGAVIDVWYNYRKPEAPEPWPCNLPFQDLDNVILSAHESGWTREQVARRWDFVSANVMAVAKGEAPRNFLFKGIQEPRG